MPGHLPTIGFELESATGTLPADIRVHRFRMSEAVSEPYAISLDVVTNDADFAFCGRGAVCGPYCQDHARLAYQPSQAKKRRSSEPDELRRMLRLAAM